MFNLENVYNGILIMKVFNERVVVVFPEEVKETKVVDDNNLLMVRIIEDYVGVKTFSKIGGFSAKVHF